MNWRLLKDFAAMDLREYYSSLWAWGGLLIATILSLYIYWYTSRAFTPAISQISALGDLDYFSFIMTGELLLMIPVILMEGPTQVIKQAVGTGSMTTLLQLPCSTSAPVVTWTLAKVPTEAVTMALNLFLISILFGPIFGGRAVASIFCLILLSAPLFLGLGLVAAAFIVTLGRGDKVLGFAINALSVFSGIYFPVTVLPDFLRQIMQAGSPLFWLLEKGRQSVASSQFVTFSTGEFFALLAADFTFLFLGLVALKLAFILKQKTGSAWILRY